MFTRRSQLKALPFDFSNENNLTGKKNMMKTSKISAEVNQSDGLQPFTYMHIALDLQYL
jgi:hypothetical protein